MISQPKLLKNAYLVATHNTENLKYWLRYNGSSNRNSKTYRCYVQNLTRRKKLELINIRDIAQLYNEDKITLVNNKVKLNITYIPARLSVQVLVLPKISEIV